MNVSEYMIDRLNQWGIRRIFGYPGDGINGLMGALRKAEEDETMEFIQTRHEEMAAFMAGGHAKYTGEVGVCMATSGPGAVHLLNGLYDAKMDHQPVVAIVGQQPRTALGAQYQQEIDLMSLFKDVAHEYVHMATHPAQVRHLVDRAVRIARSEKTVTCIIVPADVQELDAEETPPRKHGTTLSGIGYNAPRMIPHKEDLIAAAKVLNEGKKVAMLVGAGALHAGDEVIEIAEKLGAGVAKALLGKAVIPDDLPFVTGAIGLLGTKPSWTLMSDCDTLLMVGTSFPYSEFLPKDGKVRAVQIDLKGPMLGLRYPTEVNLQGDSKETLKELMPHIEKKEDQSWREKIEEEVSEWWEVLESRAMKNADPINPQRIFWELSKKLPDNCILSADSGSVANWYARDIKIRKGMMASLSGNLATMCPGVPYTIAAKFAHPDRVCIGLVGDGAMQMLGINGLITIAKYWKQWKDPRLVILVLNNQDLNQVTWEQRAMVGDPKFESSQDIPDIPFAKYAELLGLKGISVDKPEKIAAAWDEAFTADRPVILEIYADPNVPPMPPHIKPEQAVSYMKAVFKGDPDAWDFIKQTWKDKISDLVH